MRITHTHCALRITHLHYAYTWQYVALLDCLIVSEGVAGLSQRDPSVLYMLARQRFGGLTAITNEALDVFCRAQALISAHLSMSMIAYYGQRAFHAGMEAVLASQGGHGPAHADEYECAPPCGVYVIRRGTGGCALEHSLAARPPLRHTGHGRRADFQKITVYMYP